jgi:valyl-tRNA synthetase
LELKKFDSDWSYSYIVYEKALRLLHPIMPFLTEELWQRLGCPGKSIALAAYPKYDHGLVDPEAANAMQVIQALVTEIRQRRAENGIDKKQILPAELRAPGSVYERAQNNKNAIERLANVALTIRQGTESPYLLHLDLPVDRERVIKEIAELEKVIANSQRQLSNEAFLAKAPEKIVAGMRQKLAEYEAQLAKLRASL